MVGGVDSSCATSQCRCPTDLVGRPETCRLRSIRTLGIRRPRGRSGSFGRIRRRQPVCGWRFPGRRVFGRRIPRWPAVCRGLVRTIVSRRRIWWRSWTVWDGRLPVRRRGHRVFAQHHVHGSGQGRPETDQFPQRGQLQNLHRDWIEAWLEIEDLRHLQRRRAEDVCSGRLPDDHRVPHLPRKRHDHRSKRQVRIMRGSWKSAGEKDGHGQHTRRWVTVASLGRPVLISQPARDRHRQRNEGPPCRPR